MAAYLWYILKVSVCIAVFYTFYAVVLRSCTFFMLNRLYLIFGLALSFIIPALNFSTLLQSQSNFLVVPELDFFQPLNLSNNEVTRDYSTMLSIAYFIGISTLLFKLLLSTVRIIRVSRESEIYHIGQKKIVRMDSNLPFSFFNTIFLPKGEDNQMIVEHEAAHVSQLHWLDLILVEVASVLLWFNPFVFLYKNSLKLQHEYLADTCVVKDKSRMSGYLDCMLRQIQVVSSNGMVSQFYCKTIKKRVAMITKNQTSKKYLGVYLLALPLVCLMLLAFSSSKSLAQNSEAAQNIEGDSVRLLQDLEVSPEFPGGMAKFIRYVIDELGQVKLEDGSPRIKMIVKFVIEKDGNLANVQVQRDGGYPDIAKRVIQVLEKSPKWKPGIIDGKPVRVAYAMPITISNK